MTLYDAGMYWCTNCGQTIKHDDSRALWLNPKNGLLYHEECGKAVRVKPTTWRYRNVHNKERRDIKRI